jgi:hypothetical protein
MPHDEGEILKERTVDGMRAALESPGVAFVEENGEGPGVRIRKVGKESAPDDEE